MYGQTMGALNIYSRTSIGGDENLLFRKAYEIGNVWERIDINLKETQPFQIVIEGVSGGYFGDIGLDDISFTDGCIMDNSIVLPSMTSTTTQTTLSACPNQFKCKSNNQCVPLDKVCNFKYECDDKSDEAECGTCDFETSECGWYGKNDNKYVWKRKQAPSMNSQGPQVDHTFGNTKKGYFFGTEIDENNGGFYYSTILLGPKFQETGSTCKMKMWVHMNGPLEASLTFYYSNYSNSYDYERLGSLYGPLGNDWYPFELFIGDFPANYQLEIYGYPEEEDDFKYTDIAFDDIEFVDCATGIALVDKSLDCDFDLGFCDYYKDTTADFNWKREDGWPYFDHTTGNGYYAIMYVTYSLNQGDKARFYSSIQTFVDADTCVSFWYIMSSEDVDTLNFYVDQFDSVNSTSFNRTLLWKRTGSLAKKWFEFKRTLRNSKPWRIVFEGVVGKSSLSDIGVDDVSSIAGTCPPPKYCDFESDLCGFTNVNDNTANNQWLRGRPYPNSVDHTLSTSLGSFAYVDLVNGNLNSNARLISNLYFANGPECLQFWYLVNGGSNNAKLNIYEKLNNNYGSPLLTKNSHENDYWRYAQVTIGNHQFNSYQVVFEGIKLMNNNQNNVIGIDDVALKLGTCSSELYDCNFEQFTTCSWQQYEGNDLDWLLNQGETDSSDTGPHVDVTTGTDEGVYIYLESSYPAKFGEKALLVSDFIPSTLGGCFGVYYFMHGEDVYQFNVHMNDSTNGLKLLNRISGEQGFAWQQLLINVSNSNEFRIILEGIVGSSYQGDIALDEITYKEGYCQQAVTVPVTIKTTTKIYPTTSLDCNFDCNCFCSWLNDARADFEWSLNKGPTQTILTGPAVDHTTESSNGYYAFINANSPRKVNDTARLISPTVKLNKLTGGCFKFFYHMYGSDIYKLNLYMQINNDNVGKPIWQALLNKGDKWLYGQVFVENKNEDNINFITEAIVNLKICYFI
jgi:hypothetical protein